MVVLEARDRIGGRVWSTEVGGVAVDLGASWIHGTDGNPLSELAARAGVVPVVTDDDSVVVRDRAGEVWSTDELVGPSALAEVESLVDDGLAGGDLVADDTVAAVIEAEWGEEDPYLLDVVVTTLIGHEYAADPDELAVLALLEGEGFDGDDAILPGGYRLLLDPLAAGVEVRLDTPVRTVARDASGVTVTTAAGEGLVADAAVVTLPLGVLQSGAVAFDPPLPAAHRAAIESLGMGVLDKVVLVFEDAFWGPDPHVVVLLPEQPGRFVAWVNLLPLVGVPALMGFNSGSTARALEDLDDEQVVADALAALRAARA